MDALTGKLLVAMPSIGDARFSRSVILICAHKEDYSMGLVLNNPMDDLILPELLTQLGIEQDIKLPETSILDGGPVGMDRGFVIHSSDYYSEGATLDVADDLCMTATQDVLKAIATGGAPQNAIMALGYAGWGAGQIETEIAANAWIVADPHADIVYGAEHSHKWDLALETIGIKSTNLQAGGSA